MSMESALDEERLGVLALLEGSAKNSQGARDSGVALQRSSSPPNNPQSPVRSMLDINSGPSVRHSSIAGTTSGITSPGRLSNIRSMLDIGESQSLLSSSRSAQTSPTDIHQKARGNGMPTVQPRSLSDAASRPAMFGPHAWVARTSKADPTANYQFSGDLPTNPGVPAAPKRNTLAGKLPNPHSAMAAAISGDIENYGILDRGRHHSIAGSDSGAGAVRKSMSPHNRLSMRSSSPHSSMLNINSPNFSGNPGKFALDNGKVVDMNSAYRRLSDGNLSRAGGNLAFLPNKSNKRRGDNGDFMSSTDTRLEKDYVDQAEEDATVESSDDDEINSSDEEPGRGRRKITKSAQGDMGEKTVVMGRAKGPRQALSLLAAAEEEREQIAQQEQYKVRSLLEPEITVTGPGGDRLKSNKPAVHPANSFDQGVSGASTPLDSDTEADITDIKRAQKLAVIMTPVVSTPATNRCVRTIYRGDFAKMQQEAEDDQRRVRKYLVATDLSDEAQHALEWTVGTVLRDGDTLLAIYCVDEETGIGEGTVSQEQVIRDQVASIAATTNSPQQTEVPGSRRIATSPLGVLTGSSHSATPSPAGLRSRAEQERHRAVQDITDRVSRLLRKTRLQVRVVIEVIHCKSPKHLITEVIDYISPTLVILGSRGRSALKGVILGSFSNYLVTKSSVPVMVARKRLRKHGKYRRPAVRLANNLTNVSGRNLASAKVD